MVIIVVILRRNVGALGALLNFGCSAPDPTGAVGGGDAQRLEAGDSARTTGKVRRSTGQSR